MRKLRGRRAESHAMVPMEVPSSGPAQAEDQRTSGSVQLIWGAVTENLELAGMSVEQAYDLLRAPFHIAPQVTALVNAVEATPDQRLEAGDLLEFTRPAGEKGAS